MTVKELKELLELVQDDDVIVSPNSIGVFKPARCLAVIHDGYTEVRPGWGFNTSPRKLWLQPKLED